MVITFWSVFALIFASMMMGFMIGLTWQYLLWRRKFKCYYTAYTSNIEALKYVLDQRYRQQESSGRPEYPISRLDTTSMS